MVTPMDEVPFNDLARESARLRQQLRDVVGRVVDSGWYVLGPENEQLQLELAAYFGTDHCVTVANGTDALQLALSALGVTAADTVLTAANAGGYASTATRAVGARPVYADVDPTSLLLTSETLEQACDDLDSKPAAVVVTHLYGRSADMRSIMDWAEGRSIPVVEDCAQSVGAMHDGRRAGSFGHVATTSFYPTKNLGALGDGGAVLTSDADVAVRLRRLRQYGWEGKYRATMAHGRNSRMDELQAAVIRLKLPFVDAWNDRRRRIHKVYEEAAADRVRVVNSSGPGFVGHLAVVDVSDRASVAARFADARVRTDVHYPIPDHRQPLVANASHPKLPVTERAADRVLSLPLFPWLTDDEVDRVAAVLRRVPA